MIKTLTERFKGSLQKDERLIPRVGKVLRLRYSDKGINFPIKINSAVVKQDIITGIETTPMKLYKYWDEYEKQGWTDEFYERSKSGMWLGIFKWKN